MDKEMHARSAYMTEPEMSMREKRGKSLMETEGISTKMFQ